MATLALLGGGRMGEALISGLLDAGYEADALAVAEVDAERRRDLEVRFPGVRVAPESGMGRRRRRRGRRRGQAGRRPAALEQSLPSLADDTLIISIAAGVRLATLEAAAPGRPVIRAMPNTPAVVRRAATAIAGGAHTTDVHLETAERSSGRSGSSYASPRPTWMP